MGSVDRIRGSAQNEAKLTIIATLFSSVLAVAGGNLPPTTPTVLNGIFVEGCSCKASCAFETTGASTGCQSFGVYRILKGHFGHRDVSGLSLAWVAASSDRLFVYVDARSTSQFKTGESLARVIFAEGFGKLQAVKRAPISLAGEKGRYRLAIDGGKVFEMKTEPVFGGDGRTPVKIDNVMGDPYDALYQGKTVSAAFNGEGASFRLTNTSAFFQPALRVSKKI